MWGFFDNNPSTWLRARRIYLDHASATPVLLEALNATRRASALYGNPGATHAEAVEAKQSLQESREKIAHELACKAREIIFTSGLTEANNLAILGCARALSISGPKGNPLKNTQGLPLVGTHWIVSAIEHDSVLESFAEVERLGGKVTHLDPDARGIILPEILALALRPETVMVSIGWANNEIGVVQPMKALTAAIRDHDPSTGSGQERKHSKILFHSDAGQAPLYHFPHVHTLGVDLFSLGSGKLYGPRGIGALYLSNRVSDNSRIASVMIGGGQERGLRAGTEDSALAAGFAEALSIIAGERDSEPRRLKKMRDDFAKTILEKIPDAIINGSTALTTGTNLNLDHILPHMLNISLPNINAEYLTLVLDRAGIAISTKSACNEGEKASHVVEALERARNALPSEALAKEGRAENTLRFSLGRSTTIHDLDRTLEALAAARTKNPA